MTSEKGRVQGERALGAAAAVFDGRGDRMAGEEIVTEIDGPPARQRWSMVGQPPLGGVALAILLLGAILREMNSAGRGSTCWWPGATRLAPRKLWKYSIPPSERRRLEHCGQWILREQKCSVPSRAISTRPPKRWNGAGAPPPAAVSTAEKNTPSNAAGDAPSSIRRI